MPADARAALARGLLDALLCQVLLDGTFHADPHPGNVLLLTDGTLGLLDFGSVGRIDSGLRGALQRLLLALDRGDPAALADALLDVVERPEELDEQRLERALGRFAARHVAAGITPDVRMFTDLFRIIADHGLAVPPEIAAVFRSLATMEGTLTQLAPGFDIVTEARRFAAEQLAGLFSRDTLRQTAIDELASLLPMLRRLPRRIDRIAGALETGRLSHNVRFLADASDRRYITGLLHQVLLAFLAAAAGVIAVMMIGLHGGPNVTPAVTLYAFFGYCLLVVAAILAVRASWSSSSGPTPADGSIGIDDGNQQGTGNSPERAPPRAPPSGRRAVWHERRLAYDPAACRNLAAIGPQVGPPSPPESTTSAANAMLPLNPISQASVFSGVPGPVLGRPRLGRTSRPWQALPPPRCRTRRPAPSSGAGR